MNRNLYFRLGLFLLALLPISISAQCVTRNVTNCKTNTPNDAIGVAMVGQLNNNFSCCFFTDGSNGSFLFEPGATFSECANGTATLTGVIYQFGNTARRFIVNVQFTSRSCTLAPGANQETNNLPPGTPTTGWYYYVLTSGTLTGLDQTAGAQLNLVQHMMPTQVGVNAHNQGADVGKIGLAGWFEWQVVSQPSNNWLFIGPYVNGTSIADFCFVLDGPTPNYCNPTDPCATFPTPSVTTTNATGGQSNGCINITNLPTGASSSINGGTATVGKTQYCGLAPGTYTITISKDGCVKTVTAIVGNTNTDPCITNPVPTPTTTVTNATNGAANGCINITNLPTGATSALNGGAATVGKTQYCGLAAGTYTITVNLNGCVKTVYVTVGGTTPCDNVTNGGTISKTCSNGVITLSGTTPTGGSGGIDYQWLSSTSSCPTSLSQSIAGATSATYTVGSVTTKTYYVRCSKRSNCTDWTIGESNCITVTPGECPPGGGDFCSDPIGNVVGGAGSITISGITTSSAMIQVFNSSWSSVFSQQITTSTVTIPNLAAGTYYVKVTVLGVGGQWPCVCDKMVTIVVGNNTDQCITNPVPTPITTVTNATNGAANGCILITNLPSGATSALNGSVATVGKTQYCGLAAGTYTITVNLNGCVKTVYVTVGNTNTDPCITYPVPTPAISVTNATNGAANGCIFITNLPSGATSALNGGTATVGKTQYCGLAPATYTITVNLNGCIKTVTVTVSNTGDCNVTGNTISKSCVNYIPVLTGSALPGYQYVWLMSTYGCPSQTNQAIAGATGQNYSLPSRVSVKTYFVRCARPIGCTSWGTINESNCITVYADECAPNPCISFDPLKCYKIINRMSGKCLNVNGWSQSNYADINTWSYNNQANQQWKIQSVGSGYYKVMSRNCGKVLANHSTSNNSSCYQDDYYTDGAKDWSFSCNSEGYFTIKHRLSGRYLDLEDAGYSFTGDGCTTVIYNFDGSNSQQWQIVEVPCASGLWSATATEVLTMDANAELNRARVEWVNNTGYKNDFFTVEKMNLKTGDFEKIATLNTIYSGNPEQYVHFDNNPTEGDNFYRVSVTYDNGTTKYSETKNVVFSSLSILRVFPNPADDFIDLDLKQYKGLGTSIYLYNSFGQQVQFMNIDKVGDGIVHLDVSVQGTGNYILRVTAKGKRDVTKQVIISK